MRTKEKLKMTKKILIGLIVLVAASLAPAAASASVQWDAKFTWGPTQLHPGETALFTVSVRNRGTTANTGGIKVVDHLPLGVKFKEPFSLEGWACSASGTATTLTCTRNIQLTPFRGTPRLQFFVEVDPLASGTHDNTVIMSGAGSETVTDVDPVEIGDDPLGFGYIPESVNGNAYSVDRPRQTLQTQAGGHPFELRTDFDFNEMFGIRKESFNPEEEAETPYTKPINRVRTVQAILPRGLIGNPEAVPKCRVTDFLRESKEGLQAAGCDPATQIGELRVMFSDGFGGGGWGTIQELPQVALYNLTPPKGCLGRLRLQGRRPLHRPHLPDARSSARLRRALDLAVHHGHHSGPWYRADDLGCSRRSGARFREGLPDERKEPPSHGTGRRRRSRRKRNDLRSPCCPAVPPAAQPADGLRRQQWAVHVHRRFLGQPR